MLDSSDFQDIRNQLNTLHKIRIKNANRLIIGYLSINSLPNKSEMLKEIMKHKTDIFLISKTKFDSFFPGEQFVI